MKRWLRIVATVVVVCFTVNTVLQDLAFAQPISSQTNPDKLAVASGFDDILGTAQQESLAVRTWMVAYLELMRREYGAVTEENFALLSENPKYRDRPISHTPGMQYFVHEVKPGPDGFVQVMVRPTAGKNNFSHGTKTWYALCPTQPDKDGGFPVRVYDKEPIVSSVAYRETAPVVSQTEALPDISTTMLVQQAAAAKTASDLATTAMRASTSGRPSSFKHKHPWEKLGDAITSAHERIVDIFESARERGVLSRGWQVIRVVVAVVLVVIIGKDFLSRYFTIQHVESTPDSSYYTEDESRAVEKPEPRPKGDDFVRKEYYKIYDRAANDRYEVSWYDNIITARKNRVVYRFYITGPTMIAFSNLPRPSYISIAGQISDARFAAMRELLEEALEAARRIDTKNVPNIERIIAEFDKIAENCRTVSLEVRDPSSDVKYTVSRTYKDITIKKTDGVDYSLNRLDGHITKTIRADKMSLMAQLYDSKRYSSFAAEMRGALTKAVEISRARADKARAAAQNIKDGADKARAAAEADMAEKEYSAIERIAAMFDEEIEKFTHTSKDPKTTSAETTGSFAARTAIRAEVLDEMARSPIGVLQLSDGRIAYVRPAGPSRASTSGSSHPIPGKPLMPKHRSIGEKISGTITSAHERIIDVFESARERGVLSRGWRVIRFVVIAALVVIIGKNFLNRYFTVQHVEQESPEASRYTQKETPEEMEKSKSHPRIKTTIREERYEIYDRAAGNMYVVFCYDSTIAVVKNGISYHLLQPALFQPTLLIFKNLPRPSYISVAGQIDDSKFAEMRALLDETLAAARRLDAKKVPDIERIIAEFEKIRESLRPLSLEVRDPSANVRYAVSRISKEIAIGAGETDYTLNRLDGEIAKAKRGDNMRLLAQPSDHERYRLFAAEMRAEIIKAMEIAKARASKARTAAEADAAEKEYSDIKRILATFDGEIERFTNLWKDPKTTSAETTGARSPIGVLQLSDGRIAYVRPAGLTRASTSGEWVEPEYQDEGYELIKELEKGVDRHLSPETRKILAIQTLMAARNHAVTIDELRQFVSSHSRNLAWPLRLKNLIMRYVPGEYAKDYLDILRFGLAFFTVSFAIRIFLPIPGCIVMPIIGAAIILGAEWRMAVAKYNAIENDVIKRRITEYELQQEFILHLPQVTTERHIAEDQNIQPLLVRISGYLRSELRSATLARAVDPNITESMNRQDIARKFYETAKDYTVSDEQLAAAVAGYSRDAVQRIFPGKYRLATATWITSSLIFGAIVAGGLPLLFAALKASGSHADILFIGAIGSLVGILMSSLPFAVQTAITNNKIGIYSRLYKEVQREDFAKTAASYIEQAGGLITQPELDFSGRRARLPARPARKRALDITQPVDTLPKETFWGGLPVNWYVFDYAIEGQVPGMEGSQVNNGVLVYADTGEIYARRAEDGIFYLKDRVARLKLSIRISAPEDQSFHFELLVARFNKLFRHFDRVRGDVLSKAMQRQLDAGVASGNLDTIIAALKACYLWQDDNSNLTFPMHLRGPQAENRARREEIKFIVTNLIGIAKELKGLSAPSAEASRASTSGAENHYQGANAVLVTIALSEPLRTAPFSLADLVELYSKLAEKKNWFVTLNPLSAVPEEDMRGYIDALKAHRMLRVVDERPVRYELTEYGRSQIKQWREKLRGHRSLIIELIITELDVILAVSEQLSRYKAGENPDEEHMKSTERVIKHYEEEIDYYVDLIDDFDILADILHARQRTPVPLEVAARYNACIDQIRERLDFLTRGRPIGRASTSGKRVTIEDLPLFVRQHIEEVRKWIVRGLEGGDFETDIKIALGRGDYLGFVRLTTAELRTRGRMGSRTYPTIPGNLSDWAGLLNDLTPSDATEGAARASTSGKVTYGKDAKGDFIELGGDKIYIEDAITVASGLDRWQEKGLLPRTFDIENHTRTKEIVFTDRDTGEAITRVGYLRAATRLTNAEIARELSKALNYLMRIKNDSIHRASTSGALNAPVKYVLIVTGDRDVHSAADEALRFWQFGFSERDTRSTLPGGIWAEQRQKIGARETPPIVEMMNLMDEAMASGLMRRGEEALTARNLAEARRLLKENIGLISALVIDERLAEGIAEQLIAEMNALKGDKSIPVALISGNASGKSAHPATSRQIVGKFPAPTSANLDSFNNIFDAVHKGKRTSGRRASTSGMSDIRGVFDALAEHYRSTEKNVFVATSDPRLKIIRWRDVVSAAEIIQHCTFAEHEISYDPGEDKLTTVGRFSSALGQSFGTAWAEFRPDLIVFAEPNKSKVTIEGPSQLIGVGVEPIKGGKRLVYITEREVYDAHRKDFEENCPVKVAPYDALPPNTTILYLQKTVEYTGPAAIEKVRGRGFQHTEGPFKGHMVYLPVFSQTGEKMGSFTTSEVLSRLDNYPETVIRETVATGELEVIAMPSVGETATEGAARASTSGIEKTPENLAALETCVDSRIKDKWLRGEIASRILDIAVIEGDGYIAFDGLKTLINEVTGRAYETRPRTPIFTDMNRPILTAGIIISWFGTIAAHSVYNTLPLLILATAYPAILIPLAILLNHRLNTRMTRGSVMMAAEFALRDQISKAHRAERMDIIRGRGREGTTRASTSGKVTYGKDAKGDFIELGSDKIYIEDAITVASGLDRWQEKGLLPRTFDIKNHTRTKEIVFTDKDTGEAITRVGYLRAATRLTNAEIARKLSKALNYLMRVKNDSIHRASTPRPEGLGMEPTEGTRGSTSGTALEVNETNIQAIAESVDSTIRSYRIRRAIAMQALTTAGEYPGVTLKELQGFVSQSSAITSNELFELGIRTKAIYIALPFLLLISPVFLHTDMQLSILTAVMIALGIWNYIANKRKVAAIIGSDIDKALRKYIAGIKREAPASTEAQLPEEYFSTGIKVNWFRYDYLRSAEGIADENSLVLKATNEIIAIRNADTNKFEIVTDTKVDIKEATPLVQVLDRFNSMLGHFELVRGDILGLAAGSAKSRQFEQALLDADLEKAVALLKSCLYGEGENRRPNVTIALRGPAPSNVAMREETKEVVTKLLAAAEDLHAVLNVERLANTAALDGNAEVRERTQEAILRAGRAAGITLSSIKGLYSAKEEMEGKLGRPFTIPSINLRCATFDEARILFKKAMEENVGVFQIEIAPTEVAYTGQNFKEFASSVVAGAIAAGYTGPVFLKLDHMRMDPKKYRENPEQEIGRVFNVIKEAIDAGFYAIDIDASVLEANPEEVTVPVEQQRDNFTVSARLVEMTRAYAREKGIEIALGVEVGEVGEAKINESHIRAFLSNLEKILAARSEAVQWDIAMPDVLAIPSGSPHGGRRDPKTGEPLDLKGINIAFDLLETASIICKEYGMVGAVQHGASTLPIELFHLFSPIGVAEIHLATAISDIEIDRILTDLVNGRMLDEFAASEAAQKAQAKLIAEGKEPLSPEALRKNTERRRLIGKYKAEFWDVPAERKALREELVGELFGKWFNLLGVEGTAEAVRDLYPAARDSSSGQRLKKAKEENFNTLSRLIATGFAESDFAQREDLSDAAKFDAAIYTTASAVTKRLHTFIKALVFHLLDNEGGELPSTPASLGEEYRLTDEERAIISDSLDIEIYALASKVVTQGGRLATALKWQISIVKNAGKLGERAPRISNLSVPQKESIYGDVLAKLVWVPTSPGAMLDKSPRDAALATAKEYLEVWSAIPFSLIAHCRKMQQIGGWIEPINTIVMLGWYGLDEETAFSTLPYRERELKSHAYGMAKQLKEALSKTKVDDAREAARILNHEFIPGSYPENSMLASIVRVVTQYAETGRVPSSVQLTYALQDVRAYRAVFEALQAARIKDLEGGGPSRATDIFRFIIGTFLEENPAYGVNKIDAAKVKEEFLGLLVGADEEDDMVPARVWLNDLFGMPIHFSEEGWIPGELDTSILRGLFEMLDLAIEGKEPASVELKTVRSVPVDFMQRYNAHFDSRRASTSGAGVDLSAVAEEIRPAVEEAMIRTPEIAMMKPELAVEENGLWAIITVQNPLEEKEPLEIVIGKRETGKGIRYFVERKLGRETIGYMEVEEASDLLAAVRTSMNALRGYLDFEKLVALTKTGIYEVAPELRSAVMGLYEAFPLLDRRIARLSDNAAEVIMQSPVNQEETLILRVGQRPAVASQPGRYFIERVEKKSIGTTIYPAPEWETTDISGLDVIAKQVINGTKQLAKYQSWEKLIKIGILNAPAEIRKTAAILVRGLPELDFKIIQETGNTVLYIRYPANPEKLMEVFRIRPVPGSGYYDLTGIFAGRIRNIPHSFRAANPRELADSAEEALLGAESTTEVEEWITLSRAGVAYLETPLRPIMAGIVQALDIRALNPRVRKEEAYPSGLSAIMEFAGPKSLQKPLSYRVTVSGLIRDGAENWYRNYALEKEEGPGNWTRMASASVPERMIGAAASKRFVRDAAEAIKSDSEFQQLSAEARASTSGESVTLTADTFDAGKFGTEEVTIDTGESYRVAVEGRKHLFTMTGAKVVEGIRSGEVYLNKPEGLFTIVEVAMAKYIGTAAVLLVSETEEAPLGMENIALAGSITPEAQRAEADAASERAIAETTGTEPASESRTSTSGLPTDETITALVEKAANNLDSETGQAALAELSAMIGTEDAAERVRAALSGRTTPLSPAEESMITTAIETIRSASPVSESNRESTSGAEELPAMVALASEAGLQIPTHQDVRYTVLVDTKMYVDGEFNKDITGYDLPDGRHVGAADRFNLERVNSADVENILEHVKIPERTVVQVSSELSEQDLKTLVEKAPGIRIMRVDTNNLKYDKTINAAERWMYRFDLYAMMLAARQLTEEDIAKGASSPIYKTLRYFLNSHYGEGDGTIAEEYLQALVRNDLAGMLFIIKHALSYKHAGRWATPDRHLVAVTLISA